MKLQVLVTKLKVGELKSGMTTGYASRIASTSEQPRTNTFILFSIFTDNAIKLIFISYQSLNFYITLESPGNPETWHFYERNRVSKYGYELKSTTWKQLGILDFQKISKQKSLFSLDKTIVHQFIIGNLF